MSCDTCGRTCFDMEDCLRNRLDDTENARKALWGKLVLLILGNHGGGPVSVDKNDAELTDLSKYDLIEYRGESSGDYFFRVKERKTV